MGCDTQPLDIAQAILDFLPDLPNSLHIAFFGTQSVLIKIPKDPRVTTHVAKEVINMEDDPLYAIRRKRNSSLCVAMQSLKEKGIDALISAGNTGALVASATLFLSKLPGIDRAALLTLLPTKKHPVAVLDVGANPTAKAQHLLQYAAIGLAYQKSRGVEHPTVGLLNIGSEAGKGTPELQDAYKRLQQLNDPEGEEKIFVGNIEGRDVFNGIVDVLVTDGFTGNVFLKTAEGIASFILQEIEANTTAALIPDLALLRRRLHYAEYPGAVVSGVEGIVMKCHGDGSPAAFRESLKATSRLLEHDFLTRIKTELSSESQRWSLSSLFR